MLATGIWNASWKSNAMKRFRLDLFRRYFSYRVVDVYNSAPGEFRVLSLNSFKYKYKQLLLWEVVLFLSHGVLRFLFFFSFFLFLLPAYLVVYCVCICVVSVLSLEYYVFHSVWVENKALLKAGARSIWSDRGVLDVLRLRDSVDSVDYCCIISNWVVSG